MNNTRIISILIGLCFVITANAQQVPFYNHHIINPVVLNPAYAGASGDMNAYITRGQRYMGYGSGAINNALSLEGAFVIPNSGFGLFVGQQSIGIQTQLSAQLSYSYMLKIKEEHNLSFGLSAGYLDNRIRLEEINVLQESDPFLMGMKNYRPTYDFNFGVAYHWDKLKLGLSVPQLVGNKVKFSKENTRGYYALARHIMGTASYDLRFASLPKLTLTPHGLVRYVVGAPIQYDVTAHLDYEDLGWVSATYKSDYAVQFNLGFHILKDFHVGYSYEVVVGSFKNYYSGVNHEFLLGYTFKGRNDREVVRRVEVQVPDPALQRENEELKRQLKAKEDELERRLKEVLDKNIEQTVKDSVNAQIHRDAVERNEFREAKNHHFVEVDGSESPAGYYVVIGVFSEDKNVDKNTGRMKKIFPNTYHVINKMNEYSYVVIHYTKDIESAYNALKKYRTEVQEEVWILNYKME
ncbi:MAG TPA: PorP/SprF family type IX secretion system membrane protein [Brumimicrobium sp.]|nr:PorP/SprF family type IX secretion system membrane protein [Brumimicrobium sp.]